MARIPRKRIIFDSFGYDYEEWKMECLEEDEGSRALSEDTLYDLFHQYVNDDLDNELAVIDEFGKSKGSVLMTGTIGRWYGSDHGGRIFDSIRAAIDFALDGCDSIKIYDKNGEFHVVCEDHDGRSSFFLKEVTPTGMEYYDRWNYGMKKNDKRKEEYIHAQMLKYYTKNLGYVHEVYGCPRMEFKH